MKNNPVETIVGAAVIAIAGLFFFFVYSSTDISRTGGNIVNAAFENIEGISVGSDVRMSGIKVGAVVGQSLDPDTYQAKLVMSVDTSLALPDDSTARVTSEGLMGAKFIALEPGGSATMVADGGTLTNTQSALDLWSLINQFMFDKKNK